MTDLIDRVRMLTDPAEDIRFAIPSVETIEKVKRVLSQVSNVLAVARHVEGGVVISFTWRGFVDIYDDGDLMCCKMGENDEVVEVETIEEMIAWINKQKA